MSPKNDQEIMNEYLSNERTLLAWLRTGIGIMVFGFVAVKFSLFLKQLPAKYLAETVAPNSNFTIYLGIGLLIAGALTILLSYLRYKKTVQLLQKGKYQYSTAMLTFITMMLFVLSISLIAYLIIAASA
ncbi:YidH family protein [Flavobacterium artemisiae]|uniref:YidH family protein n=1 Tax=Flavobacterium artemisiae TaxID=2126556 RepID=A0ABW4HFX8_9FLAO